MYDVFLSYRRESGSDIARLVKLALENKGLKVFLDIDNLQRGHFDEKLLSYIENTANFVIILSKNALDRTVERGDWVGQEIAHAVLKKRNIVPIITDGFVVPTSEDFPPEINELLRHNGIQYSHVYFEAMINNLIDHLVEPAVPRRLPRKAKADPSRNKVEVGLPGPEEAFLLNYIRGKEDIDWTEQSLFEGVSVKSKNPFSSLRELTMALRSLEMQGYLVKEANGKITVTDKAVVFYRKSHQAQELDLSDYAESLEDFDLSVFELPPKKDPPVRLVAKQTATPVLTKAPKEAPPFAVEVRIVEEDTFLVLSADKTIREPTEHPVRLMTTILELDKLPLGTVLEKGAWWQAVVYDLDAEPFCQEQSVSLALHHIFELAEKRKIAAIGLPLLGCAFGNLSPERSQLLLEEVLHAKPCRYLQRIWLITP